MKIAVSLKSPLKEAFALIGADYLYDTGSLPEKLPEDIGMLIVENEHESRYAQRYKDVIVVGV